VTPLMVSQSNHTSGASAPTKRSASSHLEEPPRVHLELNNWYQRFLNTYNTTRPHMGINMLTPKEAIALYLKS